jgi:hypothetical protein
MGVYRSKGGVDVYSNRENIIIEPNHPILIWKANKDKLRPDWFPLDVQKKFPVGLPKLGSIHSEDALTCPPKTGPVVILELLNFCLFVTFEQTDDRIVVWYKLVSL